MSEINRKTNKELQRLITELSKVIVEFNLVKSHKEHLELLNNWTKVI